MVDHWGFAIMMDYLMVYYLVSTIMTDLKMVEHLVISILHRRNSNYKRFTINFAFMYIFNSFKRKRRDTYQAS